MKKLSLILALFVCTSMSSFAYIDSNYTVSEQYLYNTGYSKDMANMAGIVGQDPYREMHEEKMTPKSLLKRIYWYINPTANTDLDFYNHSIDINNSHWTDL